MCFDWDESQCLIELKREIVLKFVKLSHRSTYKNKFNWDE